MKLLRDLGFRIVSVDGDLITVTPQQTRPIEKGNVNGYPQDDITFSIPG